MNEGSKMSGGKVMLWVCVGVFALALGIAAQAQARTHYPLASLGHSGYTFACGVATDSQGNLYVADTNATTTTVTVYSPSGTAITTLALSGSICHLAVDSAGNLYASTILGSLKKYKPSVYPPTVATTYSLDTSIGESAPGANDGNGTIDAGPTKSVAVDPATNDVYTSHPAKNETQTVTFTGMTSESTTFTFGNLPASCLASTTDPITFHSTGATRRDRIDNALEKACTNAPPLSGTATNGGDFRVSTVASPVITFQGQFTGQNVPQLSCSPSAGTCSLASVDGVPSFISQYESNGTLDTSAIGTGLTAANYSGIDVYSTNGRVFAFDATHNQIAVFNPGAPNPILTINGSDTPAGSIGAAFNGTGLAVDQATGHVYAYDGVHNVVNEFKPTGEYVTQLAGSFVTTTFVADVAVDSSGGASDGVIYVADETTVQVFGPVSSSEQHTLSVIKDGTGSGTVSGGSPANPNAIDCGPTCDALFDPGNHVTLTAVADPGSAFVEWHGCDAVEGASGEICLVTMNANRAVTATFIKRTLTVEKEGPGIATIVSDPGGIDCGTTCEGAFDDGDEVTLSSSPPPGSKLKSWSVEGEPDACPGTGSCTVTMDADKHVVAYIAAQPIIGSVEATGVGAAEATLEATVNPNGEATAYRFEYLSLAEYEANGDSFSAGPNEPTTVPASPAGIGAGNSPVAVSERIEGLAAETAYRFRLLATNFASPPGGAAGPEATFTTYAPAQVFPLCDNDVYRSGPSAHLPDCRAYEQASPVDKNGGNVQGEVGTVKAASEGAAISFESPAGIPGGEGSQGFPTYLASREGGAWSTHGLLPDANAGTSATVEGWTEDFATVFDSVGELAVERALVRRASGGGALEPILDYTSPVPSFRFIDATLDGSKVIFQAGGAGGALVPGAVAGRQNLYAWDDAAPAAVRFVGYLPDGSGPPGETLAGQRGGTGYNRDINALSEVGDSVYFTAEGPGNLYRRLNPTAEETTNRDGKGDCVPDPALACTVHVNASEKTNGGGPEDHDTAGERPADFMAASADGSVAYFTSAEKLTDDATTGPEPETPAIARADLGDGGNLDLDFLPARVRGVGVQGEYVYWADPGEGGEGQGAIGRAKLGSSGPEDFDDEYVAGLFDPRDVALDAEHVYWTEARGGGVGDGTVGRARIGAAEAEEVDREFISGATGPEGIDVDAAHVYWVNATLVNGGGNGFVARATISGASPNQEFIPFARGDVAVDGEHVYFSRGGSSGGFIRRADLNGGGIINLSATDAILAGATEGPPLALDATHLYYANPITSVIGRVDLNGSEPDNPTELITGAAHPHGLALDAGHVYWSANQEVVPNRGNDLYRYEADAPAGERLTDVSVDTTEIDGAKVQGVLGTSEDGSRVYYAANGVPDGTIHNSPNPNDEVPLAGDCEGTGSEADAYTGDCNLYLWEGGETTFISRLDADGGASGDFSNWVPTPSVNGTFGSEYQRTARVSADGEVLLFRSLRRLTDYANEGKPELYRYRVGEAGLDCVSCDPTGTAPHGPVTLVSIKAPVLSAFGAAKILSRNLSADGNRVFFETVDALVAADTNGLEGCPTVGSPLQRYPACQDVYEWEANGTGSCESEHQNGGCLYLLSSGKDDQPSFFGDANESGSDAFVFTSERLVPQDEDDLLDAYDARAGGGLAYQHATESAPCQGEACMPIPSPAPVPGQPGSSSFSGSSDPKPARERGKRKHGKKKHKHRRHGKARKHRRAAKTNGRVGR